MEEQIQALQNQETMTLAQRRAAARRRKILENMDGRMDKILGATKTPDSFAPLVGQERDLPRTTKTTKTHDSFTPLVGQEGDLLGSDCNFNRNPSSTLPSNIPLSLPHEHTLEALIGEERLEKNQEKNMDEETRQDKKNENLNFLKTTLFLLTAILGIVYRQNILVSFVLLQSICIPVSWLLSKNTAVTSHMHGNPSEMKPSNRKMNTIWSVISCLISWRRMLRHLFGDFISFLFLSLTCALMLIK